MLISLQVSYESMQNSLSECNVNLLHGTCDVLMKQHSCRSNFHMMHLKPAELQSSRNGNMENEMVDACTGQAKRPNGGLVSPGKGLHKFWQSRKKFQGRIAKHVPAFPTSNPCHDADERARHDILHLVCTDSLSCDIKHSVSWKCLQQESSQQQHPDAHADQALEVAMIEDLALQLSQVSMSQFVPRSVQYRKKRSNVYS